MMLPLPLMSGDAKASADPIFHKTKMCKFYKAGKCTRMHDCKFAHSRQELAPLPDFSRTRMCPDFCSSGFCRNGDECAFAHSWNELRPDTKARVEMPQGAGLRPRIPAEATRPGAAVPSRAFPQSAPHMPNAQAGSLLFLPQQLLLAAQRAQAERVKQQVAVPWPVGEVQTDSFDAIPMPDAFRPSRKEMLVEDVEFPEGSWSRQTTEETLEPVGEFSRQSTAGSWADFLDEEVDEDFLEPAGEFSRQSTQSSWADALEEEEELELELGQPTEFSRQNTQGSWADLLEEEEEEELRRDEDRREVGKVCGSAPVAALPHPQYEELAHFPRLASGLGLAFDVRNTFLRFSDAESLGISALRKSPSTGDVRASAL